MTLSTIASKLVRGAPGHARRVPPAVERSLERELDEAFAAPIEPSGLLRLA